MLNKSNFMQAFFKVNKEECYKECRRYGKIRADSEFDDEDGPHRIISIEHHGITILFHLRNGVVLAMKKV